MTILFETLRDLWRLLDPRSKWLSVGLVVLLIVSGLFEMGGMLFLFGYIGALSGGGEGNAVVSFYRLIGADLQGRTFAAVAGLVFLAAFLLKNATGVLTSFLLLRFSMKRYERISTALFAGYLGSRLEVLYGKGTNHAAQMLSATTRVFRQSFNVALSAVSEIALITTVLIALLLFLPLPFVISGTLLFGLGGALFLGSTRTVSERLGKTQTEELRELQKVTSEGLRGLIDLRLANREAVFSKRFGAIMQRMSLADRRGVGIRSLPRALNELLLAAGIVLSAVYFSGQNGGIASALPTLAVAGFAGLRLTAAISRLTSNLQSLRQNTEERQALMAELEAVVPELFGSKQPPTQSQPRSAITANAKDRTPDSAGGIEADHLSFTYPEANLPALNGVTLSIPKGAFVGFCGPSGGGKSTLALVLMGLIRPDSGTVFYDGQDIGRDLRAWHSNIGYVGQSPFIAQRDLRENVAFSYQRHEIDDAKVWRALELAKLADIVREFPDGLETQLGQDGARLSGGQRQRICIARALYMDPEILVFDEATAALDNVTEAEITKSILQFSGAKTIIAIAHRLTTLKACDQIFMIEKGQVGAQGTFSELKQNSPAFQRLLKGEVAGADPAVAGATITSPAGAGPDT